MCAKMTWSYEKYENVFVSNSWLVLHQPEAQHRCEYLFIMQTEQSKQFHFAPLFFPYNALNLFFVMVSDFV